MAGCKHQHCQQQALQAAEALCRSRSVRFTGHRRQVLEILWQSHRAWTAAEIMAEMGTTQPPITYRALAFLKEQGLIHHITSLNAYIGCPHAAEGKHVGQLLICTHCRQVMELAPGHAATELAAAAKAQGFVPVATQIEMLGLCAACQP